MGVPVPEHRPGDCYVWGSCETRSGSIGGGALSTSAVCSGPAGSAPILVSDSSHLDVCEACSLA